MATDNRPGFKEYFYSDDDGNPGVIDHLIRTMHRMSTKKDKPVDDKKKQYDVDIKAMDKLIADKVKGKLGDKTDEFVKYCSDHYRENIATISDSKKQEMKNMVAKVMSDLSDMDRMMVDAFITKREQLWGGRKRIGKVKEGSDSDSRDTKWMKDVIKKLYEAKDLVDAVSAKESSWKTNKLKNRKSKKGTKPANYDPQEVRKELGL